PIASLQAATRELDLSTLAAGLPVTRLSGGAVVDSRAMDAPVTINIDLANAMPGAWNETRLPLRSLRVTLQGQPNERDRLQFTALQAQLEGAREAGRLSGQGRWQGSDLVLELTLDALRLSQLDTRMAQTTLSGPVRLSLHGLPSPDPAAAAASPVPLSGELKTELAGRLLRPRDMPLRLAADASFSSAPDGTLSADIERLALGSGDARATLSADLRRDAQQQWQLRTRGEFAQFDPSHWWAGPRGSGWRRGPHALNGNWEADLALPGAALTTEPRAELRTLAQSLRGQAQLHLQRSRLAGVPLTAAATLHASEQRTQLESTMEAAGNRLAFDGRLGAADSPDRWHADVDAPALGRLAPLLGLVPGAQPWLPTAGALNARAAAQGRWPRLSTEGELHASGVQGEGWKIGKADARWTATTGRSGAPLSLTLSAAGLARGEQRIDTLNAELAGTLASHRLQLQAASPLRPPEWTDDVLAGGKAPSRGGTLRLSASGGWRAASSGGGTWQGTLAELRAAAPGDDTPAWIAARDLEAFVQIGAQGGLEQARLAPGRVELLGATLQWSEARFASAASAGAPPSVQLLAKLDPLPVVPWLKRLQPAFGWGGDLHLGATIAIDSRRGFDADVVVERTGGDLTVTDESGTRPLGLTDLRLGLVAHGGTWHFTQAMAGSNVGVLGGAQTVRVSPTDVWPSPQAPLQGVLELRVAELGAWGPWLPPGWRLGGRLRTSASIGGRFGAPEYSGEIVGSELAVRNLLQGVHVHDGVLKIALRGTDARIEQFLLHGGKGTLRIAGGASFGDAPRADLQLAAEDFQALGRIDRRIVVSGNADLALQAQRVVLDGRFVVDEGLIDVSQADAPRLDDDVIVVNRPGGDPNKAIDRAEGSPLLRNSEVSVLVDLGGELRLRGRGIDTRLAGELRITTPGGVLAVNGTVRTVEGTYAAYGQNLAIERGIITFSGDVATPRLDILAVRPDIDVRVGVSVQGGTVDPRVRLVSEPEMSEFDKLSWLVMGREPAGLGTADTALLQRAALALLAGERGSSTGGLLKRIGLDELSLRQSETGDVQGTIVSLGKQLSDRLYVGYERGLNAAAGSWQLIYRAARRFTLRAQSGEESSVDVIWTWRWD
ncbi:translocation/assembly module TamB domain-containing protein, partial [Piscinibacter sp.]|uniref:translocation/assembly module TamB domain-containing protein n=1 Tax=Piscinibacter sp. TaxID=1903157 RepID=UPI002BF05857